MIDFHMHLLPGMDDGARNCRMAAAMIKECERQEIEAIVATPHYYFNVKTEKMIARREKAYNKVVDCLKKQISRSLRLFLDLRFTLQKRFIMKTILAGF